MNLDLLGACAMEAAVRLAQESQSAIRSTYVAGAGPWLPERVCPAEETAGEAAASLAVLPGSQAYHQVPSATACEGAYLAAAAVVVVLMLPEPCVADLASASGQGTAAYVATSRGGSVQTECAGRSIELRPGCLDFCSAFPGATAHCPTAARMA